MPGSQLLVKPVNNHCVKSFRIRSYSGPYFSRIFRENTDQNNSQYGHFLRSGFSNFKITIFKIKITVVTIVCEFLSFLPLHSSGILSTLHILFTLNQWLFTSLTLTIYMYIYISLVHNGFLKIKWKETQINVTYNDQIKFLEIHTEESITKRTN